MNNSISGLDEWNHALTDTFCPMSCSSLNNEPAENFNGSLSYRALNQTVLSQVSSSPVIIHRSKKDISQVSDAHYLVKFQMEGQGLVRHNNCEAELHAGDFVICSSIEPYELQFANDHKQAVLDIPQSLLKNRFHSPDDLIGIKMGNELPMHNILSQFVCSISQKMNVLEDDVLQSLEFNVLDLLVTSLKAEHKVKLKTIETSSELHLQRIKRFIGLHIKDYRLSIDFIAQAENISKRYLHMLFKDLDVSVSRYIQQLRLEGCYNDLINNNFDHLSISDIAFNWGFGDVSHFYRCFKSQYALTPRNLRLQASA